MPPSWARGWELGGVVLDVALAAYLLRPDVRGQELPSLVQRYLHRELVAETTAETQESLFEVDEGATAGAAMLNARAIAELARVLRPELESQPAAKLLKEVELPLQRTLANCERIGIAVDRGVLDELRAEFDSAVVAAQHLVDDRRHRAQRNGDRQHHVGDDVHAGRRHPHRLDDDVAGAARPAGAQPRVGGGVEVDDQHEHHRCPEHPEEAAVREDRHEGLLVEPVGVVVVDLLAQEHLEVAV